MLISASNRHVQDELHRIRRGKKYTEFEKVCHVTDFHRVCKNITIMPNMRVVFTPHIVRNGMTEHNPGGWSVNLKSPAGKLVAVSFRDKKYGSSVWKSLYRALVAVRDNYKMRLEDLHKNEMMSVFATPVRMFVKFSTLRCSYKTLLPSGENKTHDKSYGIRKAKFLEDFALMAHKKYHQDVIDTLDMTISILDIGPENLTDFEEWKAGAPIINLK